MSAQAVIGPRWSTSSIADFGDSAPAELVALGAHVNRCNGSRGRWFGLRCAFDTVHDFVAGRFITTLLIAGVVIGVTSIWL